MRYLLTPAIAVTFFTSAALAADPEPSVPAALAGGEHPAMLPADVGWKKFEESQKQPTTKPASREEAITQVQSWLAGVQKAADTFAKEFPKDRRRWQAKLIAARADIQTRRITGQAQAPATTRARLEEIINAPDAATPNKAEAAFMRVITHATEFRTKPESYVAFHQGAAEFAAKYSAHPLSMQLEELDVRSLAEDPTEEGAALLKKYLASTDARTAGIAGQIHAKRTKMAELRQKPIELQFTDTTSKDVDLALLRGKVVLVFFWASSSQQSLAELASIVPTYEKLRPKGFEVVGISLDVDKEKMQEAVKKVGMTWPQYFDGGGWKNKVSSKFLIDSVPTAWLIDKKGNLRETAMRGEGLEAAVQKMLAQ
jgi:peroxiredoxin